MAAELRKFVAPEVVFGVDARKMVGRFVGNFGATRALVVTDPGVIAAGWADEVVAGIEETGVSAAVFAEVTPNPRAEEVMAGAELYAAEECDLIVTVGGGSVTDCGKGIGIVHSNGRHILEFAGADQVPVPMPPLICVPTTGGTSADVSQFAIISDTEERTKVAIISKAVVPDVSLVDPVTLTTMDPYLTACTGLDAMVHAIEAFVSNGSSPLTDMHALEAIRLIARNLLPALRDPGDLEARTQVMMGSLSAGLAFSNASLGAVHAMAHSLGGYLDLAHGECNALLLRHVLDFNFSAASGRFEAIGEALGLRLRGMTADQKRAALLAEVDRLRTEAGIIGILGRRGVKIGDVPQLARHAQEDVCLVTNPRPANRRDLEVIYEEAL